MTLGKNIRVRFPPSPTGFCHVGTARMAIINYLFAKKMGGKIVFRSEDTDRERSQKIYEDDIIEQLKWLGLDWDEFYRTSDLIHNHEAVIRSLLDSGKAYVSREESKKDPSVMVEVVRLRNPGKVVTFNDVIRGDISIDTSDLGDFVIARSIRDPLYQLAVVIDDAQEGITHVIRGEDHISNTPRHILIQEALGYERPVYAHFPILLGSDRSKLSKRTGDVAIKSYREQGFLANALLNYIAVLGWTPPSNKEILSLQEMIDQFELSDVHKSGAIFDLEKLKWFNRQYIEALDDRSFSDYIKNTVTDTLKKKGIPTQEHILAGLIPLLRERVNTLSELETELETGEYDYFFSDPRVSPENLPEKRSNRVEAHKHLQWVLNVLRELDAKDWNVEALKDSVWEYASKEGRGSVLWPLRFALSGRQKSPDPFAIAVIIGQETTLRRIQNALTALGV